MRPRASRATRSTCCGRTPTSRWWTRRRSRAPSRATSRSAGCAWVPAAPEASRRERVFSGDRRTLSFDLIFSPASSLPTQGCLMSIAAVSRVALVAACLAVPATTILAADAPARQVITHETLWMMKRVGNPAVSPDGRWVVFSVLEPAYDQDKEGSGLWLPAADGSGTPRRLPRSKVRENGVTWAPDSHAIAFSGKREGDEVEQVYLLDLAGGGDARRLTTVATGAAAPQWRPDGRAILFESFVWPGAADDEANKKVIAERKARKYNVRIYEHFPIRYWNQWFDERRPTIMVQTLEEGAQARDVLSATQLARAPGFAGGYNETSMTLAPLWSPDGAEILFTATTERWNAAFAQVGYHLFRMPADGGAEPRTVTGASGEYHDAAFAPDGRSLFFKYTPQDEQVYHLGRLERVPWPQGGEAALIARDLDRDVASYAFTPDSRTVYLIVPEAANDTLSRVDAAGGKPEPVIVPATGGYTTLVSARKAPRPVLIAAWGSSVSPLEIVRIDTSARRHSNLTHIDSAAAAAIDWAVPEHFYFTSAKGRSIHSMIVRPPAFDPAKKYPLLVLIHGGAAANNPDQIGR